MKYKYCRTGCDEKGWQMQKDLFAICPICGYYMNLDPEGQDDRCPCHNLYKDVGFGRFGAKSKDETIKIYKRKSTLYEWLFSIRDCDHNES